MFGILTRVTLLYASLFGSNVFDDVFQNEKRMYVY